MFKKLITKLKEIAKSRTSGPAFDPAKFGDDLATKTDWTPLVPGGANFKTKKLVLKTGTAVAAFKPTIGALLFGFAFFAIGVGVLISGIFVAVKKGVAFESFFLPAFGLIFGSVGAVLLYIFSKPVVFDRNYGYFWKGRLAPEKLAYDTPKDCVPLGDIKALQIISEYCSGDKSSYYSYELNLVLGDASRVNVVDHGNVRALRNDAQQLAEFLGVPLWDASNY